MPAERTSDPLPLSSPPDDSDVAEALFPPEPSRPEPSPPEPPPPEPPPPTQHRLELAFPPDQATALGRALLHRLAAPQSRSRATPLTIDWLDSADGTLHARGLALSSSRGRWRLEPLTPGSSTTRWPPATQAPQLAEANSSETLASEAPNSAALGMELPALLPLASFTGRLRLYGQTGLTAELAIGELRAFAGTRPHGWLRLTGTADALAALLSDLQQTVPLTPPTASTAALALALARGEPAPAHRPTPPAIGPTTRLGDAADAIICHLVEQVLHWAGTLATGSGPIPARGDPARVEAVHQMRVALRRLRALLSVLCPPVQGPAALALRPRLRELAALLAPARDWDVFTSQTLATLTDALGHAPAEQARLTALAAAAARRRTAAHAALRLWLGGPHWRAMALELALFAALAPWRSAADPTAEEPAASFAARSLARRTKRMLHAGADLASLDDEALHELRKQGKKLRYTAEAFRPCLPAKPAKRFAERLAELQEELGLANDAATAGALIGGLGRGHGYAAGALVGLLAADRARRRRHIARAWRRFSALEPIRPDSPG